MVVVSMLVGHEGLAVVMKESKKPTERAWMLYH
jgi:hypothetical protein